MVSYFFRTLAISILVPTPSVHETITGSLILILLISNKEPKPPIISLSKELFLFLTSFFDTSEHPLDYKTSQQ